MLYKCLASVPGNIIGITYTHLLKKWQIEDFFCHYSALHRCPENLVSYCRYFLKGY